MLVVLHQNNTILYHPCPRGATADTQMTWGTVADQQTLEGEYLGKALRQGSRTSVLSIDVM